MEREAARCHPHCELASDSQWTDRGKSSAWRIYSRRQQTLYRCCKHHDSSDDHGGSRCKRWKAVMGDVSVLPGELGVVPNWRMPWRVLSGWPYCTGTWMG